MTTPAKPKTDNGQNQLEKFKEAARELETDDSEEAFDAVVRKITKAPAKAPSKPKDERSS